VVGIAVVEIVAAVAVAAVLAAIKGVAEASFPAYFSAAKTLLAASVDNYTVRSALVFVVVGFGFEVASVFVIVVEIEPEPGAMTADSVTAVVEAVVSGAEAEVFD